MFCCILYNIIGEEFSHIACLEISPPIRLLAGRDKAGRTLLHNAVLYEHRDMVRFLVEQYPNLINSRDNVSSIVSFINFI